MPTPGPLSPTRQVEDPPSLALPSPLGPDDDLAAVHMTADDVRQRLAARERDIRYHIESLKHEATTVFDDVNVGGRPLMDRIRQKPVAALAASVGTGIVLGALAGLRARAKRRRSTSGHDVAFVRLRVDQAVEDAAHRVAAGAEVDDALSRSMAPVPVAYADGTAGPQVRSSTREAIDVAVKSAIGFGVKAVVDQLVRRYTGHEETFAALEDAVD